jgi:hypothetical protein
VGGLFVGVVDVRQVLGDKGRKGVTEGDDTDVLVVSSKWVGNLQAVSG